jgi:hypothetical protein
VLGGAMIEHLGASTILFALVVLFLWGAGDDD